MQLKSLLKAVISLSLLFRKLVSGLALPELFIQGAMAGLPRFLTYCGLN
jgi:hypothetical protein